MMTSVRTALLLALVAPAVTSAQETVTLPPDVIEGFYITLDDVRTRSDELHDALARVAGAPISEANFVGRRLPDKIVPEDTGRGLLHRPVSVLDMNGDGQLTRAEWNERIESDWHLPMQTRMAG